MIESQSVLRVILVGAILAWIGFIGIILAIVGMTIGAVPTVAAGITLAVIGWAGLVRFGHSL